MKIKCDVCDKEEASVFCSADEAALCDGCDRQVHYANKLARKHHRFSLLNAAVNDSPRCDICQDRLGVLFCKEDRAILCSECDITIHKVNEHTQKHTRFLLTGAKLSAYSSSYQAASSSNEAETEIKSSNDFKLQPTSTAYEVDDGAVSQQDASFETASSMSEHLMETLPGWDVQEFLDHSCSPSPYGYCTICSTPLM